MMDSIIIDTWDMRSTLTHKKSDFGRMTVV